MSQKDLTTLRDLLAQVVQRLGRPSRELEELLEIGHGNIGKLLNGRIDLRVRHVLAFANLLKVPPADLLAAGCPEATAAATYRLSDWLGPGRGPTAHCTGLAPRREWVRASLY